MKRLAVTLGLACGLVLVGVQPAAANGDWCESSSANWNCGTTTTTTTTTTTLPPTTTTAPATTTTTPDTPTSEPGTNPNPQAPVPNELPRTGTDFGFLALLGFVAILLGILAMRVWHRARSL